MLWTAGYLLSWLVVLAESHHQHQSHKIALNSGVRASEDETCVVMASDPLGALCR